VRADRLVATLLLLQARGRVTAGEVAAELEVSERTARRDLEALGRSGLPVYAVRGRQGGWELLGGGRTDLSGLNQAEARALFRVAGPGAVTPEVKAALRKLVRALPEPMRAAAEAVDTAIVVDPTGWGASPARSTPSAGRAPIFLDALQEAVVSGWQVTLAYVARSREATTRVVDPLGLAAKGASWYLIANTAAGQRTFRVDRVTSVEPTGAAVVRPDGFDLAASWSAIRDEVEERRMPVRVRAIASAGALPLLRYLFGRRVDIGPSAADGRVELGLRGYSLESLAAELGGLGRRLEVTEPTELRTRLALLAQELNSLYA
jgi:predicted DNA-binding transcriptional regulator YafY